MEKKNQPSLKYTFPRQTAQSASEAGGHILLTVSAPPLTAGWLSCLVQLLRLFTAAQFGSFDHSSAEASCLFARCAPRLPSYTSSPWTGGAGGLIGFLSVWKLPCKLAWLDHRAAEAPVSLRMSELQYLSATRISQIQHGSDSGSLPCSTCHLYITQYLHPSKRR